jgi:hypothetical protein
MQDLITLQRLILKTINEDEFRNPIWIDFVNCGIPNPKTDDPCVLIVEHERFIRWHQDGAGKEWLGKPLD